MAKINVTFTLSKNLVLKIFSQTIFSKKAFFPQEMEKNHIGVVVWLVQKT